MNEERMAVEVREAKSSDIKLLVDLDHNYSTEYVWQMDIGPERPEFAVSFREARLPRAMSVSYPREPRQLEDDWQDRGALLVAEAEARLFGYLCLNTQIAPGAVWITDIVVNTLHRRRGIGTRLMLQAQDWAREQGIRRVILEMQSKNYPGIRLAQKLAYEFSGFNDRYYENQDIALFFAKRLG